jgi:hypothetical protein
MEAQVKKIDFTGQNIYLGFGLKKLKIFETEWSVIAELMKFKQNTVIQR